MSKSKVDRALILAAGRGSRLARKSGGVPKCLTRLGGGTLLASQLKALEFIGVQHITVVTGYRASLIAGPEIQTVYNPRWATTSMLESLSVGLRSLNDEPVIVCYGDSYFSPSSLVNVDGVQCGIAVGFLKEWHEQWSGRYADVTEDAETFTSGTDGQLLDIGGRIMDVAAVNGQFAGVFYLSPSYVRLFKDRLSVTNATSTTHFLRQLLDEGHMIETFEVIGPWFEIDTPQDLAHAERCLGVQPS